MDRMARARRHLRQPYLLDSSVAIGALAKGRSASRAINAELVRALPSTLGYDHYAAFDFCPTRLNPSDDPTRGRALRRAAAGRPEWLRAAAAGEVAGLVGLASVPRQKRAYSEWARFVVKLQTWRMSMKEFDSTLGYPGEGPASSQKRSSCVVSLVVTLVLITSASAARPSVPAVDRPAVDLRRRPTLTSATQLMRRRLLADFERWLGSLGVPHLRIASLLELPLTHIGAILASYGQVLYSTGASLKKYTETINGLVQLEPSYRRQLGSAWQVASEWQRVLPTRHRIPTPEPVCRAMIALSFLWGWWDMAVLIYLAFTCMLRPGEAWRLTVGDVLLPSRLMLAVPRMFVRVAQPKGRWSVARLEHVRCDEGPLISFLEFWLAGKPDSRRLFSGSYQHFRACHDAIV